MVSIATVVATMNDDVTHCARDWPSWKWWLMAGMATLKMVDEMIDAIVPIITVKSRYQRKRSPYRARRSWALWLLICMMDGVRRRRPESPLRAKYYKFNSLMRLAGLRWVPIIIATLAPEHQRLLCPGQWWLARRRGRCNAGRVRRQVCAATPRG
ncbi:hypothetical protein D3C72_1549550 [compost metagenome]